MLVTDESDDNLQYHLRDAELIVLVQHGADARFEVLGLSELFILDDVIQSLVACRSAVFQKTKSGVMRLIHCRVRFFHVIQLHVSA